MTDFFSPEFPWRRFREFISPAADRFAVLGEILDEAGLDFTVLDVSGNRHFLVAPGKSGRFPETPGYPASILTAHYDRAEGSPGANDNSAAVFLLIETALKLKGRREENWFVIFTDGEELKAGESLRAQGSYSLAAELKKLKLEHSRLFNFDACGVGDTLIVSTTLEYLLGKESGGERLRETVRELRAAALNAARDLGLVKVLLVPTPFSDDAGFFRAGMAAQTITVLPSEECQKLVSELRRNPEVAGALISAEFRRNGPVNFIPETWRSLNTPGDSYLRLTPRHFRAVIRFAEALCK